MRSRLVLLAALLSVSIPAVRAQDAGARSPYKQLTWADFRVDDHTPMSLGEAAAQTQTWILYEYRCRASGKNSRYTATAVNLRFTGGFDRTRSFRRSSVTERDTLLLEHEQGHLDINELKLRQLQRLSPADLPTGFGRSLDAALDDLAKRLEALYRREMADLDALQKRYERETRHGTDRAAQQEWNARLRRALQQLPPLTPPTPLRERTP